MPSLRHFIRALAPLLTTVPSFGPQEAATPPLEDCNIDIAGSKTYGGSFGSQFCATQIKQGHFVSGLKFWHTIFAIHAIQITYTNGDTTTVGDQHSMLKTSEIEWDPSTVSIRQAWGWPIEKDNIMAIGVGLSDGRSIEMGLVGDDAPVPDNDMISGTLLGISGMQGGHGIEQITFHMLESKIKGGNIQNVTFNPTAEELNKRGTNA
jgi:hypothetical protein